jgi:hypothetical protein
MRDIKPPPQRESNGAKYGLPVDQPTVANFGGRFPKDGVKALRPVYLG